MFWIDFLIAFIAVSFSSLSSLNSLGVCEGNF